MNAEYGSQDKEFTTNDYGLRTTDSHPTYPPPARNLPQRLVR